VDVERKFFKTKFFSILKSPMFNDSVVGTRVH
jgi:hypothetical protein